MKIRNQIWIEKEKEIIITLREPYWSAWKRYGWQQGVEGFGVSKEAVDYAIEKKKHLQVHVMKYGTYDINPKKLKRTATVQRFFIPRDKKPIYVLPRFAFSRVVTRDEKKSEEKEHERAINKAESQQKLL